MYSPLFIAFGFLQRLGGKAHAYNLALGIFETTDDCPVLASRVFSDHSDRPGQIETHSLLFGRQIFNRQSRTGNRICPEKLYTS